MTVSRLVAPISTVFFAASILLFVVSFLYSSSSSWSWRSSRFYVAVGSGFMPSVHVAHYRRLDGSEVQVEDIRSIPSSRYTAQRRQRFASVTWVRGVSRPGGEPTTIRYQELYFPVSHLVLASAVLPTMFCLSMVSRRLRRRRRQRLGLCPACGYDRRCSSSDVCPECGYGRAGQACKRDSSN